MTGDVQPDGVTRGLGGNRFCPQSRSIRRPTVTGDVGRTQYVRSGDGYIAFQVLSEGEPDILLINESVLPVEALHDNVNTAAYLSRLGALGRVVVFDRRGVGLSDPVSPATPVALDDWVADAVAVLDAVASKRATVVSSGPSAGLIAVLLAHRFPERVSFLSLYDAIARYRWAPDYPWGVTAEFEHELHARLHADWGTAPVADRRGRFAATAAQHPQIVEWALEWFRRGASPSTMAAQIGAICTSDVREALPAIGCPTLIINHADVEDGRFLAAQIPGARYIELDDPCHLLFSSQLDDVMAVTSELINGSPLEPANDRVLTTLLFTDIVDSTVNLATIGDRRWGMELDRHFDMVRRHLHRFDGREVKTMGDGFIATFDGPTRAVQCALAVQHDARRRGLTVRAGVHTGEVEARRGDVVGLSVHVAHRLCGLAAPAQVLVSRQVVDLVGGSDLHLEHRGEHVLKGLDGRWSIFEARADAAPAEALVEHRDTPSRREVVGLFEHSHAHPPAAHVAFERRRVRSSARHEATAGLSAREREVLGLVVAGFTNPQIGSALYISRRTAEHHVSAILTKFGVATRAEAAAAAVRLGVVGGEVL